MHSDDHSALDLTELDRRDFLRALFGLGAAGAAALGTWGLLENVVPAGTADTWHKSVCRFCGNGCGVRVGMRGGRVTDVRADEEAHNRGVMCVKGAMLRALPYVPGRQMKPMIRKDGQLVESSWDEAMKLVADQFRANIADHGPDSVAFYGSGQLYTEESYTANKLFKAGIRTNNVDGNPRLCMASAAVGYTQVFGKDEPPGSYVDIDSADVFFLIGTNTFEAHQPLWERIERRREANPKALVICVDPRRTKTAEKSDLHLAVKPGTDLLLLNAMAQVICSQGHLDRAFINEHVRFSDGEKTISLDEYRSFLDRDYTPEMVAERVGIPAATIRFVAFRFARSAATMSMWTMGINQRTQGTFLNNMLNGLHLLTGQFGRPGATPFSITGQPNACGGVRDTGALAHALPGGRVVANAEHRKEIENLWGVPEGTISPKPGLSAVDLFRAMGDGKVKAALIMCTNPAQSLPNAKAYREAMEKCFLVVAEAFADSETARLADVVLPAALWIEKEGVFGQGERRYQLIEKLLEPVGEARSDLQILVDLADRLGHGALIKSRTPEQVWHEWSQMSASSKYNFAGITYDRLRVAHGLQWPCPTTDHPGTVRRFVGGEDPLVTPGRRIEFYGQPDKKAVVFARPYVPVPEQLSDEFPMTLTTGRVLEQWHTGTMTRVIPELAQATGPARFVIPAEDALRLDIATNDTIAVESRFGTTTGRAVIAPDAPGGIVFASFYDPKLMVNDACADHYDPYSKEPEYKITAVKVYKVGD